MIPQIPELKFGLGSKKITKRESVPATWKTKILDRQNNKCAYKDCAKLHNGKKMQVNSQADFDHITPLALNGKHTLSNLQSLCPGCHRRKTQEDRDKISRKKKRKRIPTNLLGIGSIKIKPIRL